MAIRPAYYIKNGQIIKSDYEFQWFSGFSLTQKQRSIAALHNAIISANQEANPLEISTKASMEKLSENIDYIKEHTTKNEDFIRTMARLESKIDSYCSK